MTSIFFKLPSERLAIIASDYCFKLGVIITNKAAEDGFFICWVMLKDKNNILCIYTLNDTQNGTLNGKSPFGRVARYRDRLMVIAEKKSCNLMILIMWLDSLDGHWGRSEGISARNHCLVPLLCGFMFDAAKVIFWGEDLNL